MRADESNAEFKVKISEAIKAVSETLLAVGVTHVEVSYDGGGDDGGITGMVVTNSEDKEITDRHQLGNIFDSRCTITHLGSYVHNPLEEPAVMRVERALELITEAVIHVTGNRGWESGDGGGGELLINTTTGKIASFIHRDYYTGSNVTDYGSDVV